MDFELTDEEIKAIRALKRVAKIWPESLWLFSASGLLCVMREKENGENGEHAVTDSGGMDDDYIVDIADIPNDGGDW